MDGENHRHLPTAYMFDAMKKHTIKSCGIGCTGLHRSQRGARSKSLQECRVRTWTTLPTRLWEYSTQRQIHINLKPSQHMAR